MVLASSRKTSMKTWPIRRRFSCGSVTPRRASRNRSARSATRSSASSGCQRPRPRPAVRGAEQSGVDENADDARPHACSKRRAATAESTPPGKSADDPVGRPDTGERSGRPTASMNSPIGPVPRVLADPVQEIAQDARNRRRVAETSG